MFVGTRILEFYVILKEILLAMIEDMDDIPQEASSEPDEENERKEANAKTLLLLKAIFESTKLQKIEPRKRTPVKKKDFNSD